MGVHISSYSDEIDARSHKRQNEVVVEVLSFQPCEIPSELIIASYRNLLDASIAQLLSEITDGRREGELLARGNALDGEFNVSSAHDCCESRHFRELWQRRCFEYQGELIDCAPSQKRDQPLHVLWSEMKETHFVHYEICDVRSLEKCEVSLSLIFKREPAPHIPLLPILLLPIALGALGDSLKVLSCGDALDFNRHVQRVLQLQKNPVCKVISLLEASLQFSLVFERTVGKDEIHPPASANSLDFLFFQAILYRIISVMTHFSGGHSSGIRLVIYS
ncbi:hypothetical protein PMAYCL1PPCAC_16468 [Pristionchus mayeri]|uniref:Uncharacterized protein n=1 Tax=Pristionchus mayeri TaxID=1317129 RepID=A0AAN5HZA0_9BILA|nr:hypothetical protein PMAYCL1PPCAC_16468 [Pristionchus mayeri]